MVIAGGVMCGIGMVTASFGNTITHLYICVGVVGGMVPTHTIHLIDMACFAILCVGQQKQKSLVFNALKLTNERY